MIIVIGAGISGLACAHELDRGGEEVIVLEARDRPGGRCWTDRERFSVPVDLGASWIHGHRYNPLMHWARRYACDIVETNYAKCAFYDGSGKLGGEVKKEALAFSGQLEQWCERLCYKHPHSRPDLSVAAAMAQDIDRGGQRIDLKDKRIFDWSLYAKGLEEGIDLGKISLRYYEDDEPFEGSDYIMGRGYVELIEAIEYDLDVRYGRRVTSVDYQHEGRCVVRTANGEEFVASKVVCTLPLGVLKQNEVIFEPPLPAEKEQAIQGLGVGLLNKIVVEFRRAFWGDETVFAKLSGPYRHAGWMLNLEPVTKAPILVGFVAGEDARMEDQEDEAILDLFLGDLEACFGDAVARVKSFAVTRWHEDAFSRGSYAYIPVGSSGHFYDVMAENVRGQVHFAGEATHRDHPGTVHGALMSGVRVADHILRGVA